MDDATRARRIQENCIRASLRWVGAASPGARHLELGGVWAAVVPAVPRRSIMNGSTASPDALEAAYEELATAYDEAGVRAWTVWSPDESGRAARFLTERGHKLDGSPVAMIAELDGFDSPMPRDLDWDREITPRELGELNDRAYGYSPSEGFAAGYGPAPDDLEIRWYRATVDGRTACGLGFAYADDDAGVYFVATDPSSAGAGSPPG